VDGDEERKVKQRMKTKKKKKRKDLSSKVSVVSCGLSHSTSMDLPHADIKFVLSLIDNDLFDDTEKFFTYILEQLKHASSGFYLWDLALQLYDIMEICPDTSVPGVVVDDDLLWMAMEATNKFHSKRQSYMTSRYIKAYFAVDRNALTYANEAVIIVALNHPTSTEYEWTAAELMYLATLVNLVLELEKIYYTQLCKYED